MKKTVFSTLAALAALAGMAAEPVSQVWRFPLAPGARGVTLTGIPDWGKKGFTAEVWCKPESTDCGYAILIRQSFGFPKFFGTRDYDNYLINDSGKNVAGRVYTPLEPGQYHYYAMTGTPEQSISYRDGKAMRTNPGSGIPQYDPNTPMVVGNSIGWTKKNFEGEIALIRIYNRALAPDEIAAHAQLLRENKALPPGDGLIFEADRRAIMPEDAGRTVTRTLDNVSIDRFSHPRNRHIEGKPEKNPGQIGFEDLSGWTVTYVSGAVEPVVSRSSEEPLWGDYVLRTEFKRGPLPVPDAKVVLAPPQPIKIGCDFDAVNIWRFATLYRNDNRPQLNYSIQYRTADGKVHSTGPMGGFLEHGWGIHHLPLPETVKAPAEFVSITFSGFNEPVRIAYFDSLRFYTRSKAPITDADIPDWQTLGLPTRPETILPTAVSPSQVTLKSTGSNAWRFTGVDGRGQTLIFDIRPATGTLDDISATFSGKTFQPLAGGGFHWALDNLYPVKPESLLPPNSPRVRATFQGGRIDGDKLILDWQYQTPSAPDVRSRWILELKDNTLIADLSAAGGAVGEFQFGAVKGIAGKVVEVPYLDVGAWIHRTFSPGIFAGDGIYVSAFIDWYNSDASGLFGESSARPGGHFELRADTADHRWVADPNAPDPTGIVRDFSVINGGSYYWPTTAGKRNPARERIFVTVTDNFDATLPNIPNFTHKYRKETATDVWSTRMWYVDRMPTPDFFDRELAMWKLCKAYGMDELNVRLHGSTNRQYVPRRDGGPSTFIEDFVDPGIGGNAKCAEFFQAMKQLGFRIGHYTDHMLLNSFSYDAWDEDMLNLDSNSRWLYSSGMDKQTKISRMVALQKKYNAYLRRDFAPNCAYLDQITCPPPWRYTDYDARVPDAGKFSATYRVFAASLRQEESDFGPVLSEGKTQMFFAGLCDSYAQPQRLEMNLIPNFNLRKIHTLSNDCGYELGLINWKGSGIKPEVGVYRLLAYEYAYGNTAHIYGPYHGEPYDKAIPPFMIQSYFLIQPLQQFYALEPVKEILYPVDGKLTPIEAAIAANTLGVNQVKIVYENGLEVAANLNSKENFAVELHGRRYLLPPDGFAALLPGKAEAFSALIDGKRIDFMQTAALEYSGGGITPGAVAGQQAYLLQKSEKELILTPAPFIAAETATLNLARIPGWEKVDRLRLTACDGDGKPIGSEVATPADGMCKLAVDGKAFRYRITRQ